MNLWRKLRRQAMVAFTLLGMGLGFSVNSPLPTWGQVQEIPQTTSSSQEQVTELLTKLKDTDPAVRFSAARALGEIKDKSAVPALMEALKDERSFVRSYAAKALGAIKDNSAIPALIDALKDDDPSVRQSATEALDEIRKQAEQ